MQAARHANTGPLEHAPRHFQLSFSAPAPRCTACPAWAVLMLLQLLAPAHLVRENIPKDVAGHDGVKGLGGQERARQQEQAGEL